jgi:aminopeptidase N
LFFATLKRVNFKKIHQIFLWENWFKLKNRLLCIVLDMVAVPDFNSGAMENWGIIMYRESAFFYKQGVSSETNKQRIALIVAHELAHMVCT